MTSDKRMGQRREPKRFKDRTMSEKGEKEEDLYNRSKKSVNTKKCNVRSPHRRDYLLPGVNSDPFR